MIRFSLKVVRLEGRIERVSPPSCIAELLVLRVCDLVLVDVKRWERDFVGRPLISFVIVVTHYELACWDRHHQAVVINLWQQQCFTRVYLSLRAGDRSQEIAETLVRNAHLHLPRIHPRHSNLSVRRNGGTASLVDEYLTALRRAFHQHSEAG